MDDRKPEGRTNDGTEMAFLAPPTDRDYPRAIQRILRQAEGPTPTTSRFEPHHGEFPRRVDFDLIIVTGSSARIGTPEPWFAPLADYLERAVRARTPILGVCFGHQFLADQFGGTVRSLPERQTTVSTIERTQAGRIDPLFSGLPKTFESFVYHHDHVTALPPDANCLARNETGVQAFALTDRPVYGIQFHPEFTESMAQDVGYGGPIDIETSRQIYSNFITGAAGSRSTPTQDA